MADQPMDLREVTVRGKQSFKVSFLISEGRVFFSPDVGGTPLFNSVNHLITDPSAFQAVNRTVDAIARSAGIQRQQVDWYLVLQYQIEGYSAFGFYRLVLDAGSEKASVYTAITQDIRSFNLIAVRFFKTKSTGGRD